VVAMSLKPANYTLKGANPQQDEFLDKIARELPLNFRPEVNRYQLKTLFEKALNEKINAVVLSPLDKPIEAVFFRKDSDLGQIRITEVRYSEGSMVFTWERKCEDSVGPIPILIEFHPK
jgi:hypothetical protein